MKRIVILLLTLVTALLIMGVNSCDSSTWNGKMMMIKQDGKGFKNLLDIGYQVDPLYGYHGGFGYMLTTQNHRILYTDPRSLHAINYFGSLNAMYFDMDPGNMMPSADGRYVYMRNGRMDLESMVFYALFPDLHWTARLGSISPDNRYLCYTLSRYQESTLIRLYDATTMQYQEYDTGETSYSIHPVYLPEQDYIYFTSAAGLKKVRPDGSELSVVNSYSTGGDGDLRVLFGSDKLLQIAGSSEAHLIDLTTESVELSFTMDRPYASAHRPLICASMKASKIFFVRENRIMSYDWNSGLEQLVFKGSSKKANIHTGITCSWDGEWVFFVGIIKD